MYITIFFFQVKVHSRRLSTLQEAVFVVQAIRRLVILCLKGIEEIKRHYIKRPRLNTILTCECTLMMIFPFPAIAT